MKELTKEIKKEKNHNNSKEMERFWKKKAIVTLILAMFIVAIHNNTIVLFTAENNEGALSFFATLFNNLVSLSLTRAAVPLFFIIFGVCMFRDYEKKLYRVKMKNRFRSLVIPYLFWNTFFMVIAILLSFTPGGKLLSFSQPIVATFKMLVEGILLFRFNNPFWFMYASILLAAITPLIDLLLYRKWTGYIACLLALVLPVLFSAQFSVIFQGAFYSSIFFYFTGCLIGRYYFDIFSRKANRKTIIISAAVCILFILFKMAELYGYICVNEIIMNVILFAAAISFWFFCDSFADKIKARSVNNDSFMLYALHSLIGACFTSIVIAIFGTKLIFAIPSFILVYILTVIVSLSITEGLKHYTPKLYGIISGNRS